MFQLSKEETKAVRNYLILPYLKKVLELDMMWITHSHMKLPRPYLVLLRNVVSIAVQDLKQSKSLLHSKGIRVYIENTKDEIVVCTVYCRGYNQTYRYTSVQIRNQVERRIAAYFLADSRIQKRNSRSV